MHDHLQLGNVIEIYQTRIVMREFKPEPDIGNAVKAAPSGLGAAVDRFLISPDYNSRAHRFSET